MKRKTTTNTHTHKRFNKTLLIRQNKTECKISREPSFSSRDHYKNKQLLYCRLASFGYIGFVLFCSQVKKSLFTVLDTNYKATS